MDILEKFNECQTYGELKEFVKTLSSNFLKYAMYFANNFISGPDEFDNWEQDIFEACWIELNNRGISDDELKEFGINFWFYEGSE